MKKYAYIAVSTALLGGFLLAGCSDVRPHSYQQPVLTYENLQSQPVPVANVTVFDRYQSPMANNHIEHEMKNSPKEVFKKYISQKVRPSDNDGEFKFTILDASVVVRDIANKDNLVGWFTVDKAKEYKATLVVEADYKPDMYSQKVFTIKVDRIMAISDYSNLNDREKAQFELIEGLMKSFDVRMNEVLLQLPQ